MPLIIISDKKAKFKEIKKNLKESLSEKDYNKIHLLYSVNSCSNSKLLCEIILPIYNKYL